MYMTHLVNKDNNITIIALHVIFIIIPSNTISINCMIKHNFTTGFCDTNSVYIMGFDLVVKCFSKAVSCSLLIQSLLPMILWGKRGVYVNM